MSLMGLLAFGFAFIWYNYYVEELILPYYKRGNWVLIAIYAILVWLFIKAYGGFKLGYLKKTDMLYSQLISIVSVNFVAYFIISLIGRHFMIVTPMILLTFFGRLNHTAFNSIVQISLPSSFSSTRPS